MAGERNKIADLAAIEINNLHKQFPGHKALHGLELHVARGTVHGFLGPNGAGKTTAIKIMLGLSRADQGTIKILGHPVHFGRSHHFLRHVNYLPQDPVFPEGITGKEALLLVAQLYGLTSRQSEQRISRLFDYFQLTEAKYRRVGAYSRGMKQRLGLAAVLLTEPQLLILDEPVSALDPEGRRSVLEIIRRLKGKATVFFSSHILADVEKVCDRITIIDRGQLLLATDIAELLARYVFEQYLLSVKPEEQAEALAITRDNSAVQEAKQNFEKIEIISKPGQSLFLAETLLPGLIEAGITVIEFSQRRSDLEEAFFRVLTEHQQEGVL